VRKGGADAPETVVGRNPVVEALRAKVPATALYVALGIDADERVTEAVALAGKARLALMEVSRAELDRMTGRALHQGLALQVPPYTYLHPDDLLQTALAAPPR
jgi:23S rRNA (guanosine2251-2'-O)-methyltransferase